MKSISELVAAYPRLFHGSHPRIASDLPEGWFDIVDQLCRSISATLDDSSTEDFQVAQIKEKFGSLCFYFEFTSAERASGGFESVPSADRATLFKSIRALVLDAESRTDLTCQVCGSPGSRQDLGGLIATLCRTHANERRTRR